MERSRESLIKSIDCPSSVFIVEHLHLCFLFRKDLEVVDLTQNRLSRLFLAYWNESFFPLTIKSSSEKLEHPAKSFSEDQLQDPSIVSVIIPEIVRILFRQKPDRL